MRLKKTLVGLVLFSSLAVFHADQAAAKSGRAENTIGIYLGIMGEPLPSIIGFNLAIDWLEWSRLVGGYATTSVAGIELTTMAGGIRFFIPGWTFSPSVGLNYTQVTISGTGDYSGFSASGGSPYVNVGLDYTSGFHFGIGFAVATNGGGLPYISIGGFF